VRTFVIGSRLVQIRKLVRSLKVGSIVRLADLAVERKLARRELHTLHVDLPMLLVKRLRIQNIRSVDLHVKAGRKRNE